MMFGRNRDGTSASGRAQSAGRQQLQAQVERRLGYWRLFLEAKHQEVEERRNPAGLADAEHSAADLDRGTTPVHLSATEEP